MRRLMTAASVLFLMLGSIVPMATTAQTPEATPAAAGDGWHVVGQRPITPPGQYDHFLSMSPDGKWLVGLGDKRQVCIWAIATLAPQCVEEDLTSGRAASPEEQAAHVANVHPESVVWSPDSSRVAFAFDGDGAPVDSDIWVFEAESGELTDLTDDGYSGPFPPEGFGVGEVGSDVPESLTFDTSPAWSPDGQQIAFARTTLDTRGDVDVALYRVGLDGGEPVRIATMPAPPESPYSGPLLLAGLRWTPDGRQVAVAVRWGDDATDGLWLAPVAGGEPQRIVTGAESGSIPGPVLTAVSSRGHAVVYSALEQGKVDGESFFYLVDLRSGNVELILSRLQPGAVPLWASFSPDGSWLIYSVRAAMRGTIQPQIVIRNLESGTETTLLEDLIVTPATFSGGFTWATNSTIFATVEEQFGPGILLKIKRGR